VYATMEETPALAAARALASRASGAEARGLDLLEQQVCAEAGLWAPEAARRALAQARGDVPRAVGLVRVWAAALPRTEACVIDEADAVLVRRVSAAYAEVAGGQWLGIAPELSSRLLQWDDDAPVGDTPPAAPTLPEGPVPDPAPVPVRADCPRVRELLHDVPVLRSDEQGDGDDPAMTALQPPLPRPTRIGVLAGGETAGLVSLASLVLGQRREAVLAELTTAIMRVRVPHPRTGVPVVVAEVPVAEAEAVVDADVDDRPGFALGWGVSIGEMDRRAIALALIDGAVQADGATTPLVLDDQTITAAVDGSATNGFVEHLRLPHYASFASYVDQVRRADPSVQGDA
jgi:alpha-D-ribose 1-methylphosphonate 5-triphosphate synthase subunit PhnI